MTETGLSLPATRILAAQIDALFAKVTLGVCSAAAVALVLIVCLNHIGFVDPRTGFAWASYICLCAVCHILLRQVYKRSKPSDGRWRLFAFWFTVITLAEGIGWGWAPVRLSIGGRFDVELMVVLVMLAVAAGAIPAFSPYLPTFFSFFLPAIVPYMLVSFTSADPVKHIVYLLMLVYIGGMGGLGVMSNRTFKQLVGLRISAEEMGAGLLRQKEIAEQANLAKSNFLAAASHDLRQPVHALGLFVGALRAVPMAPEGQRLLEQIEMSTNAMDGLFTALLDISRLDAGTVEVHRRPFAIEPLLDRICREHGEEAKAKGVSLILKRSTAIVESDPVLVERILRNLVSNAVRYTEHGRILVGCRRRGGLVAVQVCDTGPGIAADQQDRVFREYYQLGNPERDRTKGLGLGLAIVRRLTDLLDCTLVLRSQPGRGSCFEVAIPRASDLAGTIDPESEALPGALAKGFIVVIDDELAIREAMSTLLAGWGHEVIGAGSGDEAMRLLASCPARPDLVICDYRLREGENGTTVIERLRSEFNETIPAMLITGDTAPDRLAEAKASGLLLLHKPLSNSKLRAAIVNLLRQEEPQDTTGVEPPLVR